MDVCIENFEDSIDSLKTGLKNLKEHDLPTENYINHISILNHIIKS